MANPMIPHERSDYSAIVDRPPLKLPGKARIVFWTIVNYEVWDIHKPMARQLLPAPDRRAADAGRGALGLPRIRHAGRLLALLRAVQAAQASSRRSPPMRASARTTRASPKQARDAGWEFMGHAYEQGPIHKEPDQAGMINRTMDIMEKFCGKRPVGWLGPGLTQTLETPGPARRGGREIYRRLGL